MCSPRPQGEIGQRPEKPEEIMNTLLADQYVRNHTDQLLHEAAQARLVKQARAERRRRRSSAGQ
jgi:hypothetical protein